MKIYLKTILTSEAEYPFIAAQFLELADLVDRFLIIEPGFTHTGIQRQRVGIEKLVVALPEIAQKLEYLPLPMTNDVIPEVIDDEACCHLNEKLTRGLFTRYIDLSVRDIVISTDADEVLYSSVVQASLERLSSRFCAWRAENFQLHQFMYRDTLIAPGLRFTGPSVIGCGRYFLINKPMDWRYAGKTISELAGCHFSWCFPISNLVQKVRTFAHAPTYLQSDQSIESRINEDISNHIYSFRRPPIPLADLSDPEGIWPKGYVKARQLRFGDLNE